MQLHISVAACIVMQVLLGHGDARQCISCRFTFRTVCTDRHAIDVQLMCNGVESVQKNNLAGRHCYCVFSQKCSADRDNSRVFMCHMLLADFKSCVKHGLGEISLSTCVNRTGKRCWFTEACQDCHRWLLLWGSSIQP